MIKYTFEQNNMSLICVKFINKCLELFQINFHCETQNAGAIAKLI